MPDHQFSLFSRGVAIPESAFRDALKRSPLARQARNRRQWQPMMGERPICDKL